MSTSDSGGEPGSKSVSKSVAGSRSESGSVVECVDDPGFSDPSNDDSEFLRSMNSDLRARQSAAYMRMSMASLDLVLCPDLALSSGRRLEDHSVDVAGSRCIISGRWSDEKKFMPFGVS